MPDVTILRQGALTVADYRCQARPGERAVDEQHLSHSISYVRRGSFGCQSRGRDYELVAGAFLIGHPGDEYRCTHHHHVCGDARSEERRVGKEVVITGRPWGSPHH